LEFTQVLIIAKTHIIIGLGMQKKTEITLILILILLTLTLIGTLFVYSAHANFMPVNMPDHNIEITADGNVTGTDKIQRNETIYTLIGNISGSIVVLRDNITIDGAGYTLQGNGYRYGIFIQDISGENGSGVTIKNMTITNFETGVLYSYYHGSDKVVVLSGNTIKNNSRGIVCYNTNHIIISQNKIVNSTFGIRGIITQDIVVCDNVFADNAKAIQFEGCNGKVFGNYFINNTAHITLDPDYLSGSTVSWDNGSSGNYWSDYNGIDANNDGLGDTPYIIHGDSQDSYPLMEPYKEPEPTPEPQEPEPFPTTLAAVATGTVAAVTVSAGLIVYFKNHRRQTSPHT
jgi:parallel beta-helix repeat protein